MLQQLTQFRDTQRAEDLLKQAFEAGAAFDAEELIGDRGVRERGHVYWHDETRVWGCLGLSPPEGSTPRYVNKFGTEDPRERISLTNECVVAVPKEGVHRRVAGVFAEDTRSHAMLLLHRGRIAGGRRGVGSKLFWAHFRGAASDVWDGERRVQCAVVAELLRPDVVSQVAKFVHEVRRIKALAV